MTSQKSLTDVSKKFEKLNDEFDKAKQNLHVTDLYEVIIFNSSLLKKSSFI